MMRFGIPTYRLPRDVLDAEIQRIVDLGVDVELNRTVTSVLDEMREGGFDAVFLAVGAHLGKRAYIPAGSAAKVLDAVSLLRSMEAEDAPLLGRRVVVYGGGNTAIDAARTARSGSAPRRRSSSTAGRATACRPTTSRSRRPIEEGVLMKWLSTIKHADDGKLVVERMELDETGFPQPTGELEELEADSLVLALGQETDLSLVEGVPGLEVEDGVVSVGPEDDDRYAGIFAGGDMVPAERTVTVAVGHGKTGGAQHRRVAPRHRAGAALRSDARRLRAAEHLVLHGCASLGPAAARAGAAAVDVRRGRRRARRVDGALRGPPLSLLRQLLLVRQLLRRLPRQRRDQARRAGRAVRFRLRLLQGLRDLRRGVSVRRDRDGARGDLRTQAAPDRYHPPLAMRWVLGHGTRDVKAELPRRSARWSRTTASRPPAPPALSSTSPPSAAVSRRTIASPRPYPSRPLCACQKRSNARLRSVSLSPGPSSAMCNSAQPSAARVETVIVVPTGDASIALARRLSRTCSTRPGVARTTTSPSSSSRKPTPSRLRAPTRPPPAPRRAGQRDR